MCNRIIYDNTLRLQSSSLLTMNTNELQSYYAQQAAIDRNETQGLSSLINNNRTQDDYKKCYKPYRTLNNY